MKKYRKSIVAGIAFVAVAANQFFGVELGIDPGATADIVITMATAAGAWAGVHGLRNEPA